MEAVRFTKSILILEKECRLLNCIEEILSSCDCKVIITYDPNAVYDLAKKHQPDLVILDFLLVNSDCKIICDDFKSDEQLKEIPIIVVAAYKTLRTNKDMYNCDALFVKPVDVGLVASRVNYLMAS